MTINVAQTREWSSLGPYFGNIANNTSTSSSNRYKDAENFYSKGPMDQKL